MFYTLKSKMMLTFSLLLVVPFLTMVLVFTEQSKNSVELITQSSTAQTLEQYAGYLDMLGTQVEDVAFQVLGNQLIQEWIEIRSGARIPQSQTERYVLNANVKQFLSQVILSYSNVSAISLHDSQGFVIGNDSVYEHVKYEGENWYDYVIEHGPSWVGTHTDLYQPHSLQHEPINSLVFPLVDLNTLTVQGAIKVNIVSSLINQPLSKIEMNEWRTVQLVDKTGKLMVGNGDEGITQSPLSEDEELWAEIVNNDKTKDVIKLKNDDGEPRYWFYSKLETQDWIIVGEITEKELFSQINRMSQTMLMIGVGLLLLTLAAAYWISAGMTRPLSKLSQMMRRLEMGDFNVAEKISKPRKGETGYLLYVFARMAGQLNQLIRDEFTLKLRKQDAEYKALLMQVNPHFLYNTLEVIGGLAAQKKTEQLIDVTESLGQILRHSLKHDSDTILLSDELQHIQYYISIMETRFEDSLTFEIIEDPSLKQARIIKFILQPLVENAVKYSKDKMHQAHIKIAVHRIAEERMQISITDNGEGMNTQQIHDILNAAYSQEPYEVLGGPGRRIGLRNVLVRCRLYYGEAFSVDINSELKYGTTIHIILPIHEERDEHV